MAVDPPISVEVKICIGDSHCEEYLDSVEQTKPAEDRTIRYIKGLADTEFFITYQFATGYDHFFKHGVEVEVCFDGCPGEMICHSPEEIKTDWVYTIRHSAIHDPQKGITEDRSFRFKHFDDASPVHAKGKSVEDQKLLDEEVSRQAERLGKIMLEFRSVTMEPEMDQMCLRAPREREKIFKEATIDAMASHFVDLGPRTAAANDHEWFRTNILPGLYKHTFEFRYRSAFGLRLLGIGPDMDKSLKQTANIHDRKPGERMDWLVKMCVTLGGEIQSRAQKISLPCSNTRETAIVIDDDDEEIGAAKDSNYGEGCKSMCDLQISGTGGTHELKNDALHAQQCSNGSCEKEGAVSRELPFRSPPDSSLLGNAIRKRRPRAASWLSSDSDKDIKPTIGVSDDELSGTSSMKKQRARRTLKTLQPPAIDSKPGKGHQGF